MSSDMHRDYVVKPDDDPHLQAMRKRMWGHVVEHIHSRRLGWQELVELAQALGLEDELRAALPDLPPDALPVPHATP